MKTTRCTLCASEFSEEEIEADYEKGGMGCPNCKCKGIPMQISQDAKISINVHEIRILAIWAENWARISDDKNLDDPEHESLKKVIAAIVGRIHPQLAAAGIDMPLTIAEEIKEIEKQFPRSDPTLFVGGIEQIE